MLDTYLGTLARGAGVRRAAARHGVSLTSGAREVLASPGIVHAAAGTPAARLARRLVTYWNIPSTTLGSLEDGVAAWLTATLLDRYLETHPKSAGGKMDEGEAQTVRRAIGQASALGLARLGADSPRGIGRALQGLGRAIEHAGDDRRATQRMVDSLLDSMADVPEDVLAYFIEAFDDALEGAAQAPQDRHVS